MCNAFFQQLCKISDISPCKVSNVGAVSLEHRSVALSLCIAYYKPLDLPAKHPIQFQLSYVFCVQSWKLHDVKLDLNESFTVFAQKEQICAPNHPCL